ncbi:hypothetical protein LTR37_019737 [Vermiconidia calcicola]|uniref:Uncharacterized protein n=1 Tax=Vermiconidia calcicola TaxID=1690605 RepID=A0ACC3MDH2_9PEZI|nr:hypothetical protein LTR37_019737 [Vermiconidia calcicola]
MPPIKGRKVLIIGASTSIGCARLRIWTSTSHFQTRTRSPTPPKDWLSANPNRCVTSHVAKLGGDDAEAILERLFTEATVDGPLDHIIMTAGAPGMRPLAEIDVPYLVSQAMLPVMPSMLIGKLAHKYIQRHWASSITFTGGRIAEKPVPGWAIAAGFAGGLPALTKAFALELAPLRYNHVSPGATDTEM